MTTKPTNLHNTKGVQICSVIPQDLHSWILYVQVSDRRETFTAALVSVLRKAKEDSERNNNA